MNALVKSGGPTVPLARGGEPYALPLLPDIPARQIATKLRDLNAFVTVDTRDRQLVDGSAFAVLWNRDHPPSFVIAEYRSPFGKLGWTVTSLEPRLTGHLAICDGPYSAESLTCRLLGRVTGLLTMADGRPVRELRFTAPTPELGSQRLTPLEELPEHYAMAGVGDCLAPLVPDGAKLVYSTIAPRRRGDVVVIWKKPEAVRFGEFQGMMKRLRSPVPDLRRVAPVIPQAFLVETLNPPKVYAVPACDVMAVHKAIGPAEHTFKPSPEEMRELAAQQRRVAAGQKPAAARRRARRFTE